MKFKRPVICVVGSHKEEWKELTIPLGKFLAESSCHLLTGAGAGVMETVSRAFTEVEDRKGACLGVYPVESIEDIKLPKSKYPNQYVEIHIVTPLSDKAATDAVPFSRNMVNIMSSDVIIALPGWHGTRNEVSLALQLGKPLILFGPVENFKNFPEDAFSVDTIEELFTFLRDAINKKPKL